MVSRLASAAPHEYHACMAIPVSRRHSPGLAAVGLASVLLGCGALDPRTEVGTACGRACEPTLAFPGVVATPALLPACERSARRWEAATGIMVTCTEGDRPMYDDPIDDRPQAGGATNRDRVRIDVADMLRLGALDLAVTHELGHVVFGGGHPAGGSLMAARPTDRQAPITEADLVWACERRHCYWFAPEAEAE